MRTWILAAIMLVGLSAAAQPGDRQRERLTPEQRVELQVKRMTLELDLNDKQNLLQKSVLLCRAICLTSRLR